MATSVIDSEFVFSSFFFDQLRRVLNFWRIQLVRRRVITNTFL